MCTPQCRGIDHEREKLITFCPKSFEKGVLTHAADRVKGKPITSGNQLYTWEHNILHGLKHLHFVNYETSREGNVITDMKSRLEEYDLSRYDLYGAYRCFTYAQFRSPPTDATANADSYAWMATDKFFFDKWGSLWHPIDNRSERYDSIFNVTLPNVSGVSPSSTCDAIGQPETVHCNVMDMPSGTSTINLDAHACWSNGNRHWCDVAGFGNCQVSIGWGVDKPRPEISGDRLTSAIQKHLKGKQGEDCAGQVEDTPSMCAVGGPSKHCTVGWKFCMKRLGVNCV